MTHSIASGTLLEVSHKIKMFILKTTRNPFSRVKFLFHKDTLIYWQVTVDTVCIHLAQERYKRWPVLNRVKTNLILYILCATALHLQYLIPTCCTIYYFHQHKQLDLSQFTQMVLFPLNPCCSVNHHTLLSHSCALITYNKTHKYYNHL